MSSEQTKLRKAAALLDEHWLKRGAGAPKTSSEGLRGKWQGSGGKSQRTASAGRISALGKRFAVIRVGKIKGLGKLSAAANHNSRDRETLNADPDRLGDNQLLWGVEGGQAVLDAWQDRAPEKVRSNAVHALEYVVSASPAALAEMTRDEQDRYFTDSLRFLAAKHGAENILSAVVHRDEQTPHLQALVIPLDENDRLNARAHVGGREKLRELQSDFAELVAEPYGIERGRERSVAKHQTIKEYYAAAKKEPDLTPERLREAIPDRDRGSVLKRGESDEAYTGRVVDAVATLAAENFAATQERISDLEAEKRTLADSAAQNGNTAKIFNQLAVAALTSDAERSRALWDQAQQRMKETKMHPKVQDAAQSLLDGLARQKGFEVPQRESQVERPKRPQADRSRDDGYER